MLFKIKTANFVDWDRNSGVLRADTNNSEHQKDSCNWVSMLVCSKRARFEARSPLKALESKLPSSDDNRSIQETEYTELIQSKSIDFSVV